MKNYRSATDKLVEDLKSRSNFVGAYMKLLDGQNTVRILPFPLDEFLEGGGDVEKATLSMAVPFHFFDFAGSKVKEACPTETTGDPCPLCELVGLMQDQATDDKDYRELAKYKAKTRFLILVIPGGVADGTDGKDVAILECGPMLHNYMWDCLNSPDGDAMITLEDGCDIVIKRTGKDFDTKYSAIPSRRDSSVDLTWLRSLQIPDLEKLGEVKSYAELLEIAQPVADRYGFELGGEDG